jgi:hypothetical protein
MAHNLYGNRAMFAKEPAWHQLGIVTLDKNKTLKDFMKESGNDYPITIETIPNIFVNGHEVDMSSRVIVVRHANGDDPTYQMLEVVSDDYSLVTNQMLVDWYNELSLTYPVETMGSLGKGETFFFTLDSGEVEINGELVHQFFLVTDNKIGTQKTRIAYTPVRVVCQNTLTSGLKAAQLDVQIPHRTGNKEKLQQIAGIALNMKKRAEEVNKLFGIMGKSYINLADFKKIIIETIYPESNKSVDTPIILVLDDEVFNDDIYKKSKAQEDQLAVIELFQKYNDESSTNLKGSLWNAWNAVTENEDWKKGRGKGQFVSSLFGARADVKATAFNAFAKLTQK